MANKFNKNWTKIYKDAPASLWSVTEIDHLGNSFCYAHSDTNQPAVERLDVYVEENPKLEKSIAVYHHYGYCCYCETGPKIGLVEFEQNVLGHDTNRARARS